jgi:hypothetical protein
VEVIVPRFAETGHDLDPALLHAPQGEHAVGNGLQAVGPAAENNHLKTQIVVDVDVQRRAHLFAEFVLKLGQPIAQVAHVVVIDQCQRRDGVHGLGHLGSPHLGAGKIPQQL